MTSAMRHVRWMSAVLGILALASTRAAQTTMPFDIVDRVEGELVGYNSVPRRPMAISGQHLYAVNTHSSTVVDFDLGVPGPVATFHVPKSPVSIGVWEDKLVVVCDGTYCLAILDRMSGEILELLELRHPANGPILGEPSDLLIDAAADMAFVSCAAADAVLEIDLTGPGGAPAIGRKFDLPAKDPVFMFFDTSMGTEPDVLVAPLLSGNNSGARRSATTQIQHQGLTILDFAASGTTVNGIGLPDEDLFRCVRQGAGAVEPATTGMGTVLMACGLNPATGKIWQLNTEANNKNPAAQTAAAIKGNIVKNRLSIANAHVAGQPANGPAAVIELDLSPTYPADKTVAQPSSLTFVDNQGSWEAVVTGLLTDNFVVLDQNGGLLHEHDLPDGSIPRATAYLDPWLFVYCWGTSKIEARTYSAGMPPAFTLDLGYDPTPPDVKDGRRLFYDASRSAENHASCASCHVEGRTDMAVWNLGKTGADDKGPMVTQTLAGIERMVPFHWRGEQQNHLIDFNPAFVDLLGASSQLTAEEFDHFQKFVFSIQNRPNPFENEERLIQDNIEPPLLPLVPLTSDPSPAPDAIAGRMKFNNRCEVCHSAPAGTNNDIVATGASFGEQSARRMNVKVAPFHDLYKKEQDADKTQAGVQTITITLPGLTPGGPDEILQYPLLGAGLTHAGLLVNLHEFISLIFFGFSNADKSNLTGFVFQWDQGIAPAAYRGALLDQTHDASSEIAGYLVPQANLRNCDLVAFGTSTIGGVQKSVRWWYNRGNLIRPFVPDDTSISNQNVNFFVTQAQNGQGRNVFVGLPVGSGRQFAIDFDGDGYRNVVDPSPTDPATPYVPASDTTAPIIMNVATVMVTGEVARINFETNEPCTATVTYSYSGGPQQTKSTSVPAFTHSILLNDLLQSTVPGHGLPGNPWLTYTGTIVVQDRASPPKTASSSIPVMPDYNLDSNGPTNPPPAPVTTRSFHPDDQATIGSLGWFTPPLISNPAWMVRGTAVLRVDRESGGPPAVPWPGIRVIARVLVNGEPTANFVPLGVATKESGFDFVLDPDAIPPTTMAYAGPPGPFLVSPLTNSVGEVGFGFEAFGIPPGAEVRLSIELVAEEAAGFPPPAPLTVENITTWSMPGTPASNRGLSVQAP